MKKKMKTKKKLRLLVACEMAVKVVVGVFVFVCCCTSGVNGARHHYRRTNGERSTQEISQSLSASSTNQSHASYKQMFTHLQGTRHVKRILAIGDSVTEGFITGGFHYYPYTNQLENLLNSAFNNTRFEVLNEGLGIANSTDYFRQHFREILTREKDHGVLFVVIVFGSDVYRKPKCQLDDPVADNIIELHKMAHEQSLTTILTTIPSCMDLTPSCKKSRFRGNKKLRKYAMSEKDTTILCDLAVELPNVNMFDFDRKVYWDDCVHPSRIGYDKLADLLFHVLQPAIEDRSKVYFLS